MEADNEEQPVEDSPPSSLFCSSSSSSETFLVGVVIVNIVGRQRYTGILSGREMTGLVREPLKPYDGNAIKVMNMRNIQVGYIERSSAAVLAPLIDSNLFMVEGIVPKTPEIVIRFGVPCQIHIFARIEAFPSVHLALLQVGLQLISNSNHSFALSDAVIVKEKQVEKEIKNVDDIFKLMGVDKENKGVVELLEPPKEFIKSELFSHQREGLGWLVYRENSDELPPFWEKKDDGAYLNVLTNHKTPKRPEPLRGGIFADDMGLGKTLTLISLIAINRPVNGTSNRNVVNLEEVEEEGKSSVSVGRKSNKGKFGKQVSGSFKKRKVTDTHLDKKGEGGVLGVTDVPSGILPSRATLIVCTPCVFFSVWVTQLEEHTKPGCLKVYKYFGVRTKNAKELLEYDIVLTTYSTLAAERFSSPIPKIEWWRVILDEAHIIKNPSAGQSDAVTSLNDKRRWVVTGTPIQNGSFDLFLLMNFLRFEPFSIKRYWESLVQRPLDQGDESGLTRLQVLMKTISLRRTKDNTLHGLPPKTLETCFVELSVEEREQYNVMEAEAKNVVQKYVNSGSVMRNYSTILKIILRLRQICNDIALFPSDIPLLPSNNIKDVSNNPELLRKMDSILEDGDDLDCSICMSSPTQIIITCCAHIFCQACILKALKYTNPSCPNCRHHLLRSDLFSVPPESLCSKTIGIIPSSGRPTSSKVSALLKFLLESRDENLATKSVVFSQFVKMLILLEEPLKSAGFNIMRLDGTMTAKRRANVIRDFGTQSSGSTTVLLASLKAAGTGINLTAASRVYLFEPWWNPAVEEQAVDRIHRIGQKEHVKIVRLIANNTIENRILELQEKKKTLARDAFRRGGKKNHREMGLDDFCILMSTQLSHPIA